MNRSTKSMRREVLAPLSNEKVRYIEFQGDLWVTLTFVFSHSQSVPWNFSSLNYINKENRSPFKFSHLFKLHKNPKLNNYNIYKIILQYCTIYPPLFWTYFLQTSCWVKILCSQELNMCSFFTLRVILHSLNLSISTTNLCTKVV